VLLALAAVCPSAAAGDYPLPKEGRAGKGRLELVEGIPVLHLAGTPEEMGRQHGRLLGDQTAALRDAYLERFFEGAVERNAALVFGLTLVRYMPEDYVAEIKGFAETSGMGQPSVVFANTFTDSFRAAFCSVVIASGEATRDGRLLFGRNLDFPRLGILDKATVVVVYHHSRRGRRPFVAVGWPGVVGVMSGMNDAGLCVATLVSVSQKGVKPGMPYAMMHRQILEECATPQEALELVKRTQRTSANNLAVAAPGIEPLLIEYTPEKVAVRRAVQGVLLATNHFRSPELVGERLPSCERFATLERQAAAARGRLDGESLKKMLHAANQGEMTLQAMVFEPAARRLQLATGAAPATSGKYVTLDCAKLLAAK
jgi:predicted choloylglycine hydrolase